MSLSGDPSKTEVMGWSPLSLASYMGKLKLSGCDKLVLKQSISGARFMEMTVSDLQVFPSLYVPLVAKVQSDIKKGYQKKAIGDGSEASKNPKQALVKKQEDWASDEFGNESDNDYEDGEEGCYICPYTEPQENEDTYEVATQSSPPVVKKKAPPHSREVTLQDGFCRESVHVAVPVEKPMKPPMPCPRKNPPPPRPFRPPAGPPTLHNGRSEKGKPLPCCPSHAELPKSKSSAVQANVSSKSNVPKPRVPIPADVPNREGKVPRVPAVQAQPAVVNNCTPRQSMALDPSWYQGKVTRLQAEAAIRQVNKDGAFMVRDSLRGTNEHPYTLMLLKDGKVYNIMIRRKGNSYTLGSGLKRTSSFTGVKEMIDHHTNTPLLLLEYAGRGAEPQNWCTLKHPVGLTVTMRNVGGVEVL